MVVEEATEAQLPFGMGKVNLTNPASAVGIIVSLIFGATIWNMTDSIGARMAAKANSMLGDVLGTNPATGQSSDNQAPLGGS